MKSRFIAKQIIGNNILIVVFADVTDCLKWVHNDMIHRQFINVNDHDYQRIMQKNKYRRFNERYILCHGGVIEYD